MAKQLDLRVGFGKYRLQRRIGEGRFGDVYLGLDSENNQEVAIKLEHGTIEWCQMNNEIAFYEELSGGVGVPSVYWTGWKDEYEIMVFELLGPSLQDLFHYCNQRFSLKTVLMLFDQLINRLQYIHSKHIVHQDIKPENLLMGTGRCGNVVYVTDFGLATFSSDRYKQHPRTQKPRLTGSAYFASVTGHYGQEQACGDDLESLGYTMIYFLRGSLPWEDVEELSEEEEEDEDEYEDEDSTLRRKESIAIQDLCRGLPDEFATYFHHIREPEFHTTPKYSYLRRIFRNLFVRQGYEYDNVFDWTVLKFLSNESH